MKLQDCTLLSRFSKAVLVASIFLFPIALVAQTSTFVSFDAPEQPDRGPSLSVSIGPGSLWDSIRIAPTLFMALCGKRMA